MCLYYRCRSSLFFFFNDTPTTEIYTLSLHDALPICLGHRLADGRTRIDAFDPRTQAVVEDRKSTRLNSSHEWISYAVFCLKKKKTKYNVDDLAIGVSNKGAE